MLEKGRAGHKPLGASAISEVRRAQRFYQTIRSTRNVPNTGLATVTIRCGWVQLVAIISLVLVPTGDVFAQAPTAIVVNTQNPLTELSLDGLRRLYLGQSKTLPNREPVILLETAPLRERFYSRALGMSADLFKRHWIGIVFAGEASTPPRDLGGPEDVLRYVASNVGAIAFVDFSRVDRSVKVLAINGARPGDLNYLLR